MPQPEASEPKQPNPPPMSFRDKILQGKRWMEKPMFEEDHPLEMLEDDIVFDKSGDVPKALVSERLEQQLVQPWKGVLVLKLMGASIKYNQLCSRLHTLWHDTKGFAVMDVERDFFLVKFWNDEDAARILRNGPWMVMNTYFHVQQWNSAFDANTHVVRSMVVWVRLPSLPAHFYNNHFLHRLGGLLGRVVQIDHQTTARTRGKFARMAVEIDLENPICTRFDLKGRIQKVEYENLPYLCLICGHYGHLTGKCLAQLLANQTQEDRGKSLEISSEAGPNGKVKTHVKPRQDDWVQVTRNNKARPSSPNRSEKVSRPTQETGSHYASLLVEEVEEHVSAHDPPMEKSPPDLTTQPASPETVDVEEEEQLHTPAEDSSRMEEDTGWSILENPEALWVRAFRSKYGLSTNPGPSDMATGSKSRVYNSIRKVWKPLLKGVRWVLNDGNQVRFWKDLWTLGQTPLCDLALGPIPADQLEWKTCRFVTQHGGWNWDMFERLLPATELMKIATTMPPSISRGRDRRLWIPAKGNDFSVTSVMDANNLMTPQPSTGSKWSCTFGIICWMIWNWWNEIVFSDSKPSCTKKLREISNKIREVNAAMKNTGRKESSGVGLEQKLIAWMPPLEGWMKLNTDGAYDTVTGNATAGGLIRDHYGNWKGGSMPLLAPHP
ncbi:OLC1v1005898C1 [Oldenlandia corymbosa var. corymbosa]|uniref:OLC1v1005898C1 n=1 Tax=Oldenlandia corymbosa var. corymbosa TaxID=529605 RepID=A0AAV1DFP5_OLDCO|nr:OLC1v1005898C1 [Oldenlandia corymbosa var. corymbosa]